MSDNGESYKSSSLVNDLRLEGVFCDGVIRVDDVDFQIHKVILCKCSPYFLTLFTCRSTPDKKVFFIPDLSADIMQLIIQFAYTGSVFVTEDNVQELLMVADQLNVKDVVRVCCNFLQERLCPENCVGMFQLTNFCPCAELQNKAYRCIIDHFEEVIFCKEFLQLSVQELTDILDRDDLSVRQESSLFEAVIRWIDHKPEERKEHIGVLLSKVRLALMSQTYMTNNVMSNELVKNDAECQVLVTKTLEIFHHSTINGNSVTSLSNNLARPRLPNAILLAIGGWSGWEPTNVIEAYDVRTNSWMTVTNNYERARAYHGTVFLNGSVYCIGGRDRMEYFNSVRRFDLITHTWHEVASMYHRRCYVSVTLLNGCIYAMGGDDGHSRLSTAERYRPQTNQWSLIAPMHEQRSDASCTTLNNKVYICGGFNGTECLQTAECYNPESNQWTMIGLMTYPRSRIGVIAYTGYVYAVGGFDGTAHLNSAEYYDPESNTWREVAPMMFSRSNFGIEVLDGKLFAVGGFNSFTTSFHVEYYDATTNEWNKAFDMDVFRSALSCCVVSGLPNMAEYVTPRVG